MSERLVCRLRPEDETGHWDEDIIGQTDSLHSSKEVANLLPTPPEVQTWSMWHIAALWVSMAACIPSYLLGSGLVGGGMSWWVAILTIFLGNAITLIPLALNGHVGTKFGIPFPVFLRAVFGYNGSKIAALVRAFVGCGWYGIQTWIGGDCLYQFLVAIWHGFAEGPNLGWLGISFVQLLSFLLFWGLNMLIMYYGMEHIKRLEYFAAPFLFVAGFALFLWAWISVGDLGTILSASQHLVDSPRPFWEIFISGLTGIVGFWATLALNIMDFTRFVPRQRDQVVGQAIGMPVSTCYFSFLGIFVTSASYVVYGTAIWNPIDLIGTMQSRVITVVAMLCFMIATLTTNVAANVVSPANDFSNLMPEKITFRMGGFITGLIGILIMPWKLLASPDAFILKWLVGTSSVLGGVSGLMICEYFVLRKTELNVPELYNPSGIYGSWNIPAFVCFGVSILPNVPGFLALFWSAIGDAFPSWIITIYDYAWFVSLFLSFGLYWGWSTFKKSRNEGGEGEGLQLLPKGSSYTQYDKY